jgi:phosphate-selective porin OprO and OprP
MRGSTLPVVAAAVGAVLGAMLLTAGPSYAQSTAPTVKQLQREIDLLQIQLQALESQQKQTETANQNVQAEQQREQAEQQRQEAEQRRQLAAEQETDKKWSELPDVKVGSQGLSVSSPDKQFTLRLHGIIQADGQFYSNGDDKTAPGGVTSSTFILNRVRPIVEGTVYNSYDYHIEPDFGQGKTVLQDAWLNARPYQEAQLMIGKFKAPFGIERLQTDSNLLFIQRGLTTNLIPNRDLGVESHGDLFDSALTYQLAVMNGVPNNTASVDADTNDAKDLVGRLFALPFKDSGIALVKGLGVGFAGTYGDERGSSLLSKYASAGQSTWFSYGSGVTAAGPRYRYSPQGYYYAGPFGLLADYVDDTQRLLLDTPESYTTGTGTKKVTHKYTAEDYETFSNHAWQVQAGFMLTGEDESYYGVKPARNFNPAEGGWGAWEIKARVGGLGVDDDLFKDKFASDTTSAETATEYGGGFNWYLNSNVKLDFEYLWTAFYKGATHGDHPGEGAFLSQAQIVF